MLQQKKTHKTKIQVVIRSWFRSIFTEYLSATPRQVSVGCDVPSNAPVNTRIEIDTPQRKIHEKIVGKIGMFMYVNSCDGSVFMRKVRAAALLFDWWIYLLAGLLTTQTKHIWQTHVYALGCVHMHICEHMTMQTTTEIKTGLLACLFILSVYFTIKIRIRFCLVFILHNKRKTW